MAWHITSNQRKTPHNTDDELQNIRQIQKVKRGDISIPAEASTGGALTDITHAQSGQMTDTQHHAEDEVVLDFEEETISEQVANQT